jgi:hypothetical protein
MPLSGEGRKEVERLANELLAYIELHPHAADAVDGIRQNWVPRDSVCLADDLTQAIELLVLRGKLDARVLPDGRCIYSRPHAV